MKTPIDILTEKQEATIAWLAIQDSHDSDLKQADWNRLKVAEAQWEELEEAHRAQMNLYPSRLRKTVTE